MTMLPAPLVCSAHSTLGELKHVHPGLQVEAMVEGRSKPRKFTIKIKWVASVDIMALRSFVKCAAHLSLQP